MQNDKVFYMADMEDRFRQRQLGYDHNILKYRRLHTPPPPCARAGLLWPGPLPMASFGLPTAP
jgi:hypothetical protein